MNNITKSNNKHTKDEIISAVKNNADILRSAGVDSGDYKDYVLTLFFYKYVCDLHLQNVYNITHSKTLTDREKKRDLEVLETINPIKQGSFFADVLHHTHKTDKNKDDTISMRLNNALVDISQKCKDMLIENKNVNDVFEIFADTKYNETRLGDNVNTIVKELMMKIAPINLTNIESKDVLGEVYMYLIEYFASTSGKKGGEFYTPKDVTELLVKVSNIQDNSKICDPTMGSGSLLLTAIHDLKSFSIYGQEVNKQTYNIARMNMFISGATEKSCRLEHGDILINPKLIEKQKLIRFDHILANPPFAIKLSYDLKSKMKDDETNKDKDSEVVLDSNSRFKWGIPPKNTADYAFIEHMISTAKPKKGKVSVIVPHGVLFRGGEEGKIRTELLKDNLLDTVIGLPSKLFQTTSIPVAILIFDRSREIGGENEDRKDILFIDASQEFFKDKKQNHLAMDIVKDKVTTRDYSKINKISKTVINREEIEKFSSLVSLAEIEENDYNLNISRYIDITEKEEIIPLDIAYKEFLQASKDYEKAKH